MHHHITCKLLGYVKEILQGLSFHILNSKYLTKRIDRVLSSLLKSSVR